MSCKYRDIFGKAGEGIHSTRIPIPGIPQGIALVDTLLTLVAAYLIGRYYRMKPLHVLFLFLLLVVLGIVVHSAFCVETPLTKLFCSN